MEAINETRLTRFLQRQLVSAFPVMHYGEKHACRHHASELSGDNVS
jgi:hypothetical protein